MKIISGFQAFSKQKIRKPVLVIGTFDGVHLGHRAVIKKAVDYAKKHKLPSVVLTFYPHPMRITNPNQTPSLLTSIEHRLNLISRLESDACLVVKFNRKFSNMLAGRFAEKILKKKLDAACVFVGQKFNFGRGKGGNAKALLKYGEIYGFKVFIVEALKKDKQTISSSLIRKFIEQGKISDVQKLLGRRFSILGTVIKGDKRGRVLGFPTANIDAHQEVLPPAGVYAVKVKLDAKSYNGMLYIGKKSTFYNQLCRQTVEVNIFNLNKNLYGKNLEIEFIKKTREDMKFENAVLLSRQLKKDKIIALKILDKTRLSK